jgi:hypothetical protein
MIYNLIEAFCIFVPIVAIAIHLNIQNRKISKLSKDLEKLKKDAVKITFEDWKDVFPS